MSRAAEIHQAGARRFLLLGGGGFVGRALARDLAAHGHEVHVIEVPGAGQPHVSGARSTQEFPPTAHDVRAAHMARLQPDIVVDLAYLVGSTAEADLALATQRNVVDPLRAMGAAHRAGVRRYVQASSIAVYGPDQSAWGREVTEADMLPLDQHTTNYGALKCVNEFQLARFAAETGIVCSSVRLSIVVGAFRRHGLASWPSRLLTEVAVGTDDVHVPVPSTARASVLLARDAARLIRLVSDHPNPQAVYNSGGHDVSARELTDLAEAHGRSTAIRFEEDAPTPPFLSAVSGARASRDLGFALGDVRRLVQTVMEEARAGNAPAH